MGKLAKATTQEMQNLVQNDSRGHSIYVWQVNVMLYKYMI